MNKNEQLKELSRVISKCDRCQLSLTRKNVVVGDGNICSKILLVGEGPGQKEDETGEAFVGPAGKLLDKELASIGLDRSKVYISNIVKCRPPKNRNPNPKEQESCIPFLRKQFLIQKPTLIVMLGAVASKRLLSPDFRITREHGKIFEKKGVIFIGTFHPSALLRDPSKKALAWEDLKIIKKIIEEKELLNFKEE